MSRGCWTLMQPMTPCRRGWTAWQISCRVALQALPIIPARPIGYVPSHARANEFLPRLPFPQSMRSRDKHRGLRNPLEAERFQVSVEGERRVDAFPLHQDLGCAIRVRNARRSMSPEGCVGLPLDLFGDMQHSQGRGAPDQAEDGHSDASTRLVKEKRDGLVDHVVRRVKETERVAGFRDSVKDADCGCVIPIVFQGPGDECSGVQEQLHRLRRRQRTSSTVEASVRLPVENVLDKSKSGSQDKSPSRDAHSERACRAASFKVSPLASAVRKTNA